MSDKLFFDTNVLIYAAVRDTERTPTALAWLSRGGSISAQVLNEFTNTARRKFNHTWDAVVEAVEALRILCTECVPITEHTHHVAVGISRRHGFHTYDALIVASALETKCTMLVTEDLQEGQIINDQLTIHNPFR